MDSTLTKNLMVVFGLLLVVHLAVVTSQDILGPPMRPEVFRNPGELREYLKQLNEYFAIVGRPRFGRSISKRSVGAMKRGFGNFGGLDVDGDGVISPADLAYYSQYIYRN